MLFLGGPLFFFKGLQKRFQETLKLDDAHAHFPALAPYAIAAGAAEYAGGTQKTYTVDSLLAALEKAADAPVVANYLPPLFEDEQQYEEFKNRHAMHDVMTQNVTMYEGDAYLGIDCGSTTTKLVLIGEDDQILFHHYQSNKGNPADVIREQLTKLYELCGDPRTYRVLGSHRLRRSAHPECRSAWISVWSKRSRTSARRAISARMLISSSTLAVRTSSASKSATSASTIFRSTRRARPAAARSSKTFARSMGYSIEEFCKLGLFAKHPIDLGSRCTVFMNSSVKQAQKDGAGIDAISAGLSVSVVKNALYKVIRAHSPDDLGQHIVVQGGTFLNDAILRSFEQEIGRDVTRPAISGLMGAYGAALHAKDNRRDTTTLIGTDILAGFEHNVRSTRCGLCENHCNLTINDFGGGRRFISGNRCERPLGGTKKADLPNLYKWKLEKLKSYGEPSGIANPIAKIGLPFGLNNFELLPFWTAFLRKLGFETVLSDVSTRDMYMQGQHSIPSDTVCYPAKLMHGHIENLLEKGVDAILLSVHDLQPR